MADKEKDSDKSMGLDPFEDFDTAEFMDAESGGAAQPIAGGGDNDGTGPLGSGNGTDHLTQVPESDLPAGKSSTKGQSKTKAKSKAKSRTKAERPAKSEADATKQLKASTAKATSRAKTKPKASKKADVEMAQAEDVPEGEPLPETVLDGAGEPEAEVPAASTAAEQTVSDSPPSVETAEPDEEAFDLLDDLVATLDEEVEQAFGPGPMADLAPEQALGDELQEQHVVFSLAGTEYAVHVDNVTEIGRPLDLTPLPNVPDWLLGLANLRGDIISMVDLRSFLGMDPLGFGQEVRMLVAQARDEDLTAGIMVDQVNEIRYLAVDRIGEPTARIEDQVTPYLRGVYQHDGRLLVVLDLDRMLLSPEMRQFEPA